jgi:hypothetical protein
MNKEQQQIIDKVYGIYFDTIRDDSMDWLDEKQFIDKIKTDTFTSELWRLKIEERELSEDERYELCAAQKSKMTAISEEDYIKYNIPTKLITITYNDKTIESYE